MCTNVVETVSSFDWKVALIPYVQQAIEAGKDVVQFTTEQAPILVKEVITYHMITSGMGIGFGLLVLASIPFFIKMFKKWYNNCQYSFDQNGVGFLGVICNVALVILGMCMFATNIGTFIKTIFAPRLFLLEYLSSLVK